MGSKFSATRPRQRPPAVCKKGPAPENPLMPPVSGCPTALPGTIHAQVNWDLPFPVMDCVFAQLLDIESSDGQIWIGSATSNVSFWTGTFSVRTNLSYGWLPGGCHQGITVTLYYTFDGAIATGIENSIYTGGLPFAYTSGIINTNWIGGTVQVILEA